jgi:glycosyltransferase involved in cell wall biosynthesis
MSERLSIAHVTEAFGGGVATYMTHVLPALAARGHDVTLYCCNGRNEPTFDDAVNIMNKAGVSINLLSMRKWLHPWKDVRAIYNIRREFKSGRYDLVHTHGTKAGMLGRLAARWAGVPVLHTPHCYAFLRAGMKLQRFFIRMMESALVGSTSGLIAVSESERQAAIQYGLVDSSRCAVVHNGLPSVNGVILGGEKIRQMYGLSPSSFVVTMAARMVDYKGISLLLDAAELCREMDVVFVLAGYGEMESWARTHVVRSGLSDHVRILGHIRDVPSLLAASNLCVLCSEAEGQPYALLEAMRAGCPIVATDVPGIHDMLENGKTAILVPRDARQVAGAVQQLINDDTLRKNLASQANKRFKEAHLLDKQVDALIETYERFRGNHN